MKNPVLGGIPFREESHFERNPVSGGIPFREESRFGRYARLSRISMGGVPVGRDPGLDIWSIPKISYILLP